MTEGSRYEGLTKLPPTPAMALLKAEKIKLEAKVEMDETTSIPDLLDKLEEKGAVVDMLRVLAHALPPRESAWWGCLAARDTLEEGAEITPCIKTSEDWVFKPGDETQYRARQALDAAEMDDDTTLVAQAVSFANGTLGPYELEDYEAPPGGRGVSIFGIAMLSYFHDEEKVDAQGTLLIARAIDIAKGGNGKVEQPDYLIAPVFEDEDDEDEDEEEMSDA